MNPMMLKRFLPVVLGSVVALAVAVPAFATDESTAVDDLADGVDSISAITDTATDIAVPVIVFAAGALVVKRLMYA